MVVVLVCAGFAVDFSSILLWVFEEARLASLFKNGVQRELPKRR